MAKTSFSNAWWKLLHDWEKALELQCYCKDAQASEGHIYIYLCIKTLPKFSDNTVPEIFSHFSRLLTGEVKVNARWCIQPCIVSYFYTLKEHYVHQGNVLQHTQQVNLSLSTFCSKNCLKLGKTYRVLLCKYQLPCIIIVHFARIASWLEYYQEGKHWTTILSLLENFSHIT